MLTQGVSTTQKRKEYGYHRNIQLPKYKAGRHVQG